MTEMFLIWAYLTINSLLSLSILVFFSLATLWGMILLATHDEDDYKHISEKANKYFNSSIKILIVVLVCKMIIPNKTEVGYIVGGAAVFNLASSSEAQKLPENVLKAANRFLEGMNEDQK